MSKTIEFFWDVGSPYTYMASTQIDELAKSWGAQLICRPFLLGGVFRDTGNQPPANIKIKGKYMLNDLSLWAKHYQVPFHFPEFFPVNSLLPMRVATVLHGTAKESSYRHSIMNAYWVEGKDPSSPETIQSVLKSLDLNPKEILEMTQNPEIKQTLKNTTSEAVQRGAFGAPSFFIGEQMFWGNDRLQLMEAYLKS